MSLREKIFCVLVSVSCFLFAQADLWRVNYVDDGKYEAGILSGIPKDAGASISRKFEKQPEGTGFRLNAEGLEKEDLAVSIRGDEQIYIRASADGQNSFVFNFDKLPDNLYEMRIYFNLQKRFTGELIKLKITGMEFFQDEIITQLPLVVRQRIFSETKIFPRIQSKYDLMKNYLGGYSLGSGTFIDRPLFFDRSLADDPLPLYNKLNSVKGFARQLQSAMEFADGLGLFLAARKERHEMPLLAADQANMKNAVFIECTPPKLKNFAQTSKDIDFVLATSAAFRHNGALVIGSYHGEVYTPEQWQEILAPYREKYGDKVLFMCELRSMVYRFNSEYRRNEGKFSTKRINEYKAHMRKYLDVVDGVNFSATNHFTAKKAGFPENVFNHEAYERFVIPLFASVLSEPAYKGKKLLGLSAHKGYGQVRSTTANIDEEGTRSMRMSLQISLLANPDYIVMPEWNETNENTHVEPLVSNARTNQRVINAIRNRATPDLERKYPNIILSFRQDNDLAAAIPVEVLGLPDSGGESKLSLRFLSPSGEIVYSSPEQKFSHKKIEEFFYMLPAKSFATYHYLIPELHINWNGKILFVRDGLPHLRLKTAPNQVHCYVKIPLRDLPDPEKFSSKITFSDTKVFAEGDFESLDDFVTVELLADDIPLAAVDLFDEYSVPEGEHLLLWRRQVPVAVGFDRDIVKISALKGTIRARTPHIYGLAGMEVPEQPAPNVLQGKIGGGASIREFFFFASSDAVLDVEQRGERAQVAVSDLLKNKRFRKSGSAGVSWQLLTLQELPEIPFPINKKKVNFSLEASLSDSMNARYSLRAITRGGRVYRSQVKTPTAKIEDFVAYRIWNLLTDRAETVQVPRSICQEINYNFDPKLGDILPAVDESCAHDAMLGGFDYRTHSADGWDVLDPPQWRYEDNSWVLDFKPGCGIILGTPIFSRAAFEVELEIKFSDLKEQTVLDVLGAKLPVKIRDGFLTGEIVTRAGKFAWESKEKLNENQYYEIKIQYDLEYLRIFLDGKETAFTEAENIFEGGWIMAIGGVPIKTKAPIANVLHKEPKISNKANEGFNLTGTLKALKITNFPN